MLALFSVAAAGCDNSGTPEMGSASQCAGKCDGATQVEPSDLSAVANIEIANVETVDGEAQRLRLVGAPHEEALPRLVDGDRLAVELSTPDSALTVSAVMSYEEDGAGAFVSDFVETSDLLPYKSLQVRVFGSLGEAIVDQSFTLELGEQSRVIESIELFGDCTDDDGISNFVCIEAAVHDDYITSIGIGDEVDVVVLDPAGNIGGAGSLYSVIDPSRAFVGDPIELEQRLVEGDTVLVEVDGTLEGQSFRQVFVYEYSG